MQQLVQSRAAQEPVGSPSYLGGSPQLLHPHRGGMPKPGKQQQPASPKLTKRQSGNPFAYDGVGDLGMGQLGTSPLSRGVSGNPFAATLEMNLESSNQDQAGCGHRLAGHLLAVDSNVNGVRSFGSGMEGNTAAGGNVQQCAEPQASASCAGLSANSASSASVLKNPEMSPLQNGLIRCAAFTYSCVHILQAFLIMRTGMSVLLHTVSWLSCMVVATAAGRHWFALSLLVFIRVILFGYTSATLKMNNQYLTAVKDCALPAHPTLTVHTLLLKRVAYICYSYSWLKIVLPCNSELVTVA